MGNFKKFLKPAILAAAISAAVPSFAATQPAPAGDPLEGYNRMMFSFNETVDYYFMKPVATGYDYVMPDLAQKGISNFFGNINDVWSAANNFLEGRGERGLTMVARVGCNTMFGLGGLIDVASDLQMTRYRADFGQTMAVWGVGSGPYFVVPFMGPSTIRDAVGLIPDYWVGDGWGYVDKIRVRNIGYAVRIVNWRSSFLDAGDMLNNASTDKYAFVRDSWLQARQAQIFGEAPQKGEWEDVKPVAPSFKAETGKK